MDVVHPAITRYLEGLAAYDDEPVLLEMEQLAREKNFPIIGRLCGQYLELLTRSIGAKRIFELGSGYGYSAYWFSRATGADAEIHLTDMDPENKRLALDFLSRAGIDGPIDYHVSDALAALADTTGDFDIVYCDIDKEGYPDAWEAGRTKVRVGGYYICDNMLWSGRVTDSSDEEDPRPKWTDAIKRTNEMIASDPQWRSIINPTRDGVVTALRIA
ncbi:MAG: caffeoyl-CoA O-methyltransferase [Actinomycetota bacterium]|jgi:predicted O-methyltransferase YrrM|nr:caffeoyl-CoA O-methyltransferase [Actinomycetota bacterium]